MRVASSASWHAIKAVALAIIRTENGVASTDAGSGTIQIHVPCSMMHHGHERRRRTSHGAILYVWMCGRARSGGRVGRRGCSSHVMSHVARRSRVVDRGGRVGERRAEARCPPRSHHHGHMVKSSDWSGLLRLVAEKLLAYGLCDVAEFVLLLTRERRDGLLG